MPGSFVLGGSGGALSPHSPGFGENGNLRVAGGTGAVLEFDAVPGTPVGADSLGGRRRNCDRPLTADA
jgi:hypothetical protein